MKFKERFARLEFEDKIGLFFCLIMLIVFLYLMIIMEMKLDFSMYICVYFITSAITKIFKKLKNIQDNE